MRWDCLQGCVSGFVPVPDEERSVEALLASVDVQTLMPREAVLVDAGSPHRTVALALGHRGRVPTRIVARVAKAAWVKRCSFGFSTLHPGRILGADGSFVVIDAATLTGLPSWLRAKEHL